MKNPIVADDAGFVLIIVLIFISMISGIMLAMSNSAIFEAKTIENFLTYYHRVYLLDAVFEKAKEDILEENFICSERWCPISGGFLKNSEKATYTFDFLQTVPCFQIKGVETLGADFFKVSAKAMEGIDALEIERTFVKSAKNATNCQGMVREIESGYLEWRIVQ